MNSAKVESSRLQLILGIILLSLWVQVALSVILLVRLNQVYLLSTGAETATVAQALGQPVRVQNMSVGEAPMRGPADAPVTIVTFSDFECSYCARHHSVLRQIEEKYSGEVLIAFRHFPRQSNPETFESAAAAVCAQRQGKFWEMHDLLYARQSAAEPRSFTDLAQEIDLDSMAFDACLKDDATRAQIERDIQDGRAYGVEGTPTYFVNGRLIRGTVSFEEFDEIVSQER